MSSEGGFLNIVTGGLTGAAESRKRRSLGAARVEGARQAKIKEAEELKSTQDFLLKERKRKRTVFAGGGDFTPDLSQRKVIFGG